MKPRISFLPIACTFLFLYFGASTNEIHCQTIRQDFFDYHKDSVGAKNLDLNIPSNRSTGSLGTSIIVDYFGNARVQITTSAFASKNDTLLAIHSLFNGIGNLACEIEVPLKLHYFLNDKMGFIALSLNDRVATLVSTGVDLNKSIFSNDMGINLIVKLSGEFGTLDSKVIIRNALVTGNNSFTSVLFDKPTKLFYYNSIQIKIKAKKNIYEINIPLAIQSLRSSYTNIIPIYAGVALNF